MTHIEYGEKNLHSPNNMKKLDSPKYIYRKSDGARFTRQKDGKYTLDSSVMKGKLRSRYARNTLVGSSFVLSEELVSKEDFYTYRGNDGHGDID